MSRLRAILTVVFAVACAKPSVSQRLAALEMRVAELEAAPAPAAQGPSVAEGELLFVQAQAAYDAGEYGLAKGMVAELQQRFAGTGLASRANGLADRLRPIGITAPEVPLDAIWLQGGPVGLRTGTTLVVFWELWCPHCKREVPAISERVAGHDVDVLLVTRLTRSSTAAASTDFLRDNGVPWPTFIDEKSFTDAFSVSGIPAAALVKDGVVVWRDHPASLDDQILDRHAPQR